MSAHDTMLAYADCNMGWAAGESQRCLKFRDREWTSVDAWARTMSEATAGGYNEFSAERVAEALRPYAGKVECLAAREYSVAVYLRGDRRTLAAIKAYAQGETMRADEAGWTMLDPPAGGMAYLTGEVLRLWWD